MRFILRSSIVLLLVLPCISRAEKYAGEFMSLGMGARSLGMGSAFVALSDDATATYWNPAGTSQLTARQVFLQHCDRFNGIVTSDGGSYVHPLKGSASGRSALSVALVRSGVSDIPVTAVPDPESNPGPDNRPFAARYVGASYYVGYLSYSRAAGERYNLGGSFKFVQADLGTATGMGAGVDLGALIHVHPRVTFGLCIKDVTTTVMSWETGKREYVMPTGTGGFAINTPVPFPEGRFVMAADLDTRFENRGTASQFSYGRLSGDSHLGAEYTYRKVVSARAGLDTGHLTFGAGLSYKGFSFDYAHLDHDDLGATARISGSYSF
jgi:hypothetical protein